MRYLQSYKIFEGRVPRDERIQVYKDENIIVLLPLTHRALQKYASGCAWCINSDEHEWKEYHEGDTLIIIQRNPKQVPYGITENPTDEEIYTLDAYEDGRWGWDDVKHSLLYDFDQDEEKGKFCRKGV